MPPLDSTSPSCLAPDGAHERHSGLLHLQCLRAEHSLTAALCADGLADLLGNARGHHAHLICATHIRERQRHVTQRYESWAALGGGSAQDTVGFRL